MEPAGTGLPVLYDDPHKGAFYLPAYVEEMLEDVEGKY